MRRLFAALAASIILSANPALASLSLTGAGLSADSSAPATYIGPGDIVSFTAWWGLRAYNGAIVTTGTQALVNIRRTSDSRTCDIIVNSSGGAGLLGNCSTGGDNGSTPLSWATRGTFTGVMTGTTSLATTGDPCTAVANDQLLGAGFTTYTTIQSITSCAAGTGAYVLNKSYTLSSFAVTDLIPTVIPELYDQTGNGHNLLQATTANQPTYAFNCATVGTLPCFQIKSSAIAMAASGTVTPATGTVSFTAVAERATGTTLSARLVTENGSTNNRLSFSTANLWGVTGGSSGSVNATATDAVWHAVQALANGASAVVNIDGTETTGTATGNTTAGAPSILFNAGSGVDYETEMGFSDNVAWSSGNRSSLCHNEYAYNGTGASC